MTDNTILIVDDNTDFCSTIAEIVGSLGYETQTLNSPQDAMAWLDQHNRNTSLILLDIEFGNNVALTGLDVLEYSRKNFAHLPVIMISGKGSIETAVRATKLGALNFIEKSIVTKEKIKEVLDAAIDRTAGRAQEKEIRKFLELNGIIGKSRIMMELGDNIVRYGRTDLNVLITGETGTGKKLVAKAIHAASRRAKNTFVTVDIPNIPRELFQSELFGHVKGAFSGATDTKRGLFHEANRGTLFLDEIGDMSLELQSNLFVPLEEKYVRRVGAVENDPVDIRFISATDQDLLRFIRDGKFREPLYHRLRECEIHIPALRDRMEDISYISDFYVREHNERFSEGKFIAPAALDFLSEQIWKGNVRELASTIKVTLQTTKDEQIEVIDLQKVMRSGNSPIIEGKADALLSSDRTLKEDLAQVDKKKIESTLERCFGNVSKSASQLGISRETLHNKIRKYDIDVMSFRRKK